jgi:putative membrane protein
MTRMDMTLTTLFASTNDWDHSWWPIWPLLWLVVIVTVVWLFKRKWWTAARPVSGAERARDILAERFARGEITSDEYRERLEQLR